jgi:hypothetical protein
MKAGIVIKRDADLAQFIGVDEIRKEVHGERCVSRRFFNPGIMPDADGCGDEGRDQWRARPARAHGPVKHRRQFEYVEKQVA